MILLELFWSFCKIGFTSFGGLSMAPLINSEMLSHGWMTLSEVSDIVAIAEMTPGPIAVNAATFVGTKLAGLPGALAATAGVILPACILVTCIARLYLKYRNLSILQGILGTLRPAVVAMIASAGVLLLVNAFWDGGPVTLAETNWTMLLLFAGCLLLLRKTKLSPILIMVLAGVINVVKAVLAG